MLQEQLTQVLDSLADRERKVIAVSYTHLDVYKRQVQELAEALDVPANDIIKRLFLLGTPLTMTQSMSDDLVELDVYKRQDKSCT